jgi:hypothetical protein
VSGGVLLILGSSRLVILEVPKTASLALRGMLEPFATPLLPKVPRHITAQSFLRRHKAGVVEALGGPVETVAVMREPLRRLQSWYRYRLRDQVAKTRISTRDVSFEQFITAYLNEAPPPFARIGRQDRFVGWNGVRMRVDHLFDYRRLDLLVDFLSERLGVAVDLPHKNASPEPEEETYLLSDEVLARLLKANEAEFSLYRQLRKQGWIERNPARRL